MSLASLGRMNVLQKALRAVSLSSMMQRPMAYKSAISLETIYPNSSLKLTTPTFATDSKEKFSGFIPMDKLDITYSASSGPGGQNVNKVHTKVDLRFKLSKADWLHPDIRARLLEIHGNKLTKDGYMIFRSDLTRSQQLNLADCLQKLRTMIRNAQEVSKEPSVETQEKIRQRHLKASRLRLATKRESALRREQARPPTALDL